MGVKISFSLMIKAFEFEAVSTWLILIIANSSQFVVAARSLE